jgi:hypothetical protein
MTTPHWSPVDDSTADLLTLVADEGHPSADFEWDEFVTALRYCAARDGGKVYPNRLRPLVRGVVAPRRIGAFTHRAVSSGLLSWAAGEWQISDDTEGRNSGRPAKVYRLSG